MSDNHLNDGFFSKLAKMLPGMKSDAGKLKSKALVSNMERKGHERIPCSICGSMFDGFNGFGVKKKQFCESCQKNLDQGYTALVTMDGKRYAFTRFPNAPEKEQAAVAGKVMTVSSERMDQVAKMFEVKSKPENN